MKFFGFIFMFITLSSCADLHKGDQLLAVETMHKTLDSITTVLIENDYKSIEEIRIESKDVAEKIKGNYKGDTLDIEFAKKLDDYKQMLFSFDPLKNGYILLLKNTKEEKKALTKLMDEIEKGNGERAKYQEFILNEQKKTKQICMLLSDYVSQLKKSLTIYHQNKDAIYDYSFSLIAK